MSIDIFPKMNASQMKPCTVCKREFRPIATNDYDITPVRFGSFNGGIVVALCDKCLEEASSKFSSVFTINERIALLEVQMSEVRHKVGITEVDEIYERAMADHG